VPWQRPRRPDRMDREKHVGLDFGYHQQCNQRSGQ
jgi:hypothetical protein